MFEILAIAIIILTVAAAVVGLATALINAGEDADTNFGNQPVGGTSTKCAPKCWPDDYEKDISITTYGRYYRQYKPDGTEVNHTFSSQFKLIAPVKTGSNVIVQVKFKPEKQTGVTDDDVASAKTKLETGVITYLDRLFTLEADDPECGKKSFTVKYEILWVDSGEDYTIKIHDTYPRPGVTGRVMDVAKTTSDWTYAHEFGHCVGLPDEYSYTTDTETVKYIKPDGTLDTGVSAPPNGKKKTDADATIMAAVNNTIVLERHGWNVAIETQELLTAKIGRNIKCTISK